MQAGAQGRLPGGGRVWRTGILQKKTGHPRQKGEERQRHRPKGEHGVVREWAKNQGAGARTQCELRKASSLRAPCPISSPAPFQLAGGDLHLRRIFSLSQNSELPQGRHWASLIIAPQCPAQCLALASLRKNVNK